MNYSFYYSLLLLSFFPVFMIFAAISDVLTMTIPIKVSIGLLLGFIAIAIITKMSWNDVLLHLSAGGLVLIIAFSMFAFGWIGGGDAKLASAASLWFGFELLLEYMLITSILGGAITVIIIYARGYELPVFLLNVRWIERLHNKKTGIPYGLALSLSALILYQESFFWEKIITS